jgi:hypothetical protein
MLTDAEVIQQAAAMRAYIDKGGGSLFWFRSKDFGLADRQRVLQAYLLRKDCNPEPPTGPSFHRCKVIQPDMFDSTYDVGYYRR